VKPELLRRDRAGTDSLTGVVLVSDVRDSLGRVVVGRGTLIGDDERIMLEGLPWETLHVVRPDAGDLLEAEAGSRLALAASGSGVRPGEAAGGHWPLVSTARGIVEVRRDALLEVNGSGELAVYTVSDGQVVEGDEVVARAKIIPFVVDGAPLQRGVSVASAAGGVIAVRGFRPARLGVVVRVVRLVGAGASSGRRWRKRPAGSVRRCWSPAWWRAMPGRSRRPWRARSPAAPVS
jgi:molybdenum cofactor cytidylyltransferase